MNIVPPAWIASMRTQGVIPIGTMIYNQVLKPPEGAVHSPADTMRKSVASS